MITVLFFGRLREQLGVDALDIAAGQAGPTVATLRQSLMNRGTMWSEALSVQNLLCAVNQVQALHDAAVKDGDEVAFFPPVTGG
ncbi:MAG: molybdopterin converting factor subunit 1 [Pseudomonadota bacterium]